MFAETFQRTPAFLMEGALGERLKREYHLPTPPYIELSGHVASQAGKRALTSLWLEYAGIASHYRLPFLATTPTRRANPQRIHQALQHQAIPYPAQANALHIENSLLSEALLYENVRLLQSVRQQTNAEMYIGGMIGSSGDAYTGHGCLPQQEAADFHTWAIRHLVNAGVDFIYAALIPTLPEAMGIATAVQRVSAECGHPISYIMSFTLRQGGTLADGTYLSDAIDALDHFAALRPLCYMTNCIHPAFVYEGLMQTKNRTNSVRQRFRGIQANTARLTYAQLDGAADLYSSDPADLAADMLRLQELVPIQIWGGCCGTDGRHMEAIARSVTGRPL